MNRREIREAAFILLFEKQFHDCDVKEIIEFTVEDFGLELEEDVISIVEGVLSHVQEIDDFIEKYSPTRKLNRISKTNIAILRIAIFEIIYKKDVPDKVAINEAVEIAKKYAGKNDSGFINAVLGSFMGDRSSTDV